MRLSWTRCVVLGSGRAGGSERASSLGRPFPACRTVNTRPPLPEPNSVPPSHLRPVPAPVPRLTRHTTGRERGPERGLTCALPPRDPTVVPHHSDNTIKLSRGTLSNLLTGTLHLITYQIKPRQLGQPGSLASDMRGRGCGEKGERTDLEDLLAVGTTGFTEFA